MSSQLPRVTRRRTLQLAAAKDATLKELVDCQGAKVDIGGYYLLDDAKANIVMTQTS